MAGKGNKIRKITAWVVGILFAFIILVPCLLYIPIVQEGAKNLATSYVNKNTAMKMDIGRIMLKFPLILNVERVLILEENGDTMVYAGNADVKIKFLPLLKMKVDIQHVAVDDVVYNMTSEDGSMILGARVNHFKLVDSDVLLDKNEVNLRNAVLNGGSVKLIMDSSKQTTEPEDTTATAPWLINIGKIQMNSVAFNMQMLPLIDALDAMVGSATMTNSSVDLGTRNVNIRYFGIDYADVKYLYPATEQAVAEDSIATETEVDTALWTIRADVLRLNDAHAVYAVSGAEPVEGLDMNYLEVSDINVGIDSLYNCGTDIRLLLTGLTARERCGVFVTSGEGKFAIDSKMMSAKDVKLQTMQSMLQLNAEVGADIAENVKAPINVDVLAKLGVGEMGYMYPSMKPMLDNIPQYNPLEMELDIKGTSEQIDLKKALMNMPQYISVEAGGHVKNVMDTDKLSADVNFAGNMRNLDFVKPIILTDTAMYRQIDFPEMKLNGSVVYAPNIANAKMDLRLTSGEVVFKGDWNGNSESYDASVRMDSFPVQSILPLSQLKGITARANVKGAGYDPFKEKTTIDAAVAIDEIAYGNNTYRNISATAKLANKNAVLSLFSKNTDCDLDMNISCLMDTSVYEFAVDGNINNVDLKALKMSETTSKGKGRIIAFGTADINNNVYDVDLNLNDFKWSMPDVTYETGSLNATFVSTADNIMLSAREEDLIVDFNASCGIDSFISDLMKCQKIMEHEINAKYLDLDTLQQALPQFSCDMKVGKKNLLQQALKAYDIKVKEMNMNIVNDSTIYMSGQVLGIESGTMKVDTVSLYANQKNKYLTYKLHAGNQPGTNDEFAQVTLRGGVRGNALGMLLEQQNIRGEQGFRFGVNAFLSDTAVNVNVFPKEPVIGYRSWTVNDSNKIAYNYIHKHFDADLSLKSDSSFVSLRTEHSHDKSGQEDVLLSIGGVQISEWLKVSPFIPPMSGVLSADMKLKLDRENILGGGIARMKDFKYNRKAVGDFDFKLGMELDPEKNYVRLISAFDIDGRKTITARGSLNDTTSRHPYNITLTVDSFPLKVANPFIPGDMANLSGALNGTMNVVGSFTEPIINGYLQSDGAEINMPLFGSHLSLSDNKIPIDSSLVKFDGFKVYGSNKNAINVDGYVNLLPIDNPRVDMRLKGNNVEFVNSKQQRKMEVFGKGYANIDATARGTMNDLNVDASLTILPATNLTYIMQTDVSAIATQTDENMVKFVSFADTAEVNEDSISSQAVTSSFKLNAKLNIQQGSKFNVYLSNSGNDRVEIEGNGILNYSQSSLGDMRLVGQFTLDDGFVRYTPPLLSEKLFEFTPGSYVSWSGDVLNPVLNIKAVDTMKASVSQEGQDSRLINFLVSLSVTNTLSNMNLEFDLSTNDDVTVQNELLSMSPSQRSSQAINLLLYNTYTGQGTTASMSSNPLYSFLNSQINRWAANTIKGVDLTLGVNQYDETKGDATSKSTTYSYKISKSLFNDRFKIVVGGNYNPSGDTEDNFANSLLNDISFVYMLNQSGTMSVKLFRHTGYESILEGEVTETGGAFVMKRKLSTLRNFFRFGRRKRSTGTKNAPVKQDTVINLETLPESNKFKK